MDAPTKAGKPAGTTHNVISSTMATLSITDEPTGSASNVTPTEAEPASGAEHNKGEFDDIVLRRRPARCSNERYLKGPGIFNICVSVGVKRCPTCGLVEVSAAAAEISTTSKAVTAYGFVAVVNTVVIMSFVTIMNSVTLESPTLERANS
jgi:hypothetical protein